MAKYITPAVTPFVPDGYLDTEATEALIEHLINGGIDGILILGSIGEFFAQPMKQKKRLITFSSNKIAHRVPLIVGTADMVFENVLELSEYALVEGAEAVIIITPYYFRLEPDQVFNYYHKIAKCINGPIYIYNFPDRTGYNIPPETVLRLAEAHPNIVGIKDTISGLDHTRELIKLIKPVRPDFEIYSGFDDNFAHNVLCGGDGCIAGLSNVAPELCHRWVNAVNSGNWKESAQVQQIIDRLMDIYSVGAPFIPFIKAATALRGVPIGNNLSFPFPGITDDQRTTLSHILARESLI